MMRAFLRQQVLIMQKRDHAEFFLLVTIIKFLNTVLDHTFQSRVTSRSLDHLFYFYLRLLVRLDLGHQQVRLLSCIIFGILQPPILSHNFLFEENFQFSFI
jgi:hypothetical protein